MRNSIFIFIIGAICFAAGYGSALLILLEDEVDGSVAQVNQLVRPAPAANHSRPVTIQIIKEVPVYQRPNQYQQGLLGSIRNSFVREASELLVDGIPMSDLVPLVARISGYREDDIWRMQQPHNFAKNLVSLGLGECSAGDDAAADEQPRYGDDGFTFIDDDEPDRQVLFSRQPRPDGAGTADDEPLASAAADSNQGVPGIVFANRFFQSNASRIYANFRLPADYEYQDVLVKWCRFAPSQRNIVFGPHKINLSRSHNYVWYETREPELGDYQVSIYSSEELPRLIARQSYSIEADPQ